MEQRGRRTPALDSRTKLLLLPQTCSSPMRHHHPSSCPSPNLGDNLYSSLFRSWHIQTIGKSCHLCLGNLVGICLPLSNPSPDPLISSHQYLQTQPWAQGHPIMVNKRGSCKSHRGEQGESEQGCETTYTYRLIFSTSIRNMCPEQGLPKLSTNHIS